MRISDWSSDVCSSDLNGLPGRRALHATAHVLHARRAAAGLCCSLEPADGDVLDPIRRGGPVRRELRLVLWVERVRGRRRWPEPGAATGEYRGHRADADDGRQLPLLVDCRGRGRSEERRVGKEGGGQCRCWWLPD